MKLVMTFLGFCLAVNPDFSAAATRTPFHFDLDLEATSIEYLQKIEKVPLSLNVDDPFAPIMDLGQRNTEWLKYLNQFLDKDHQIRFSQPGKAKGIPMDKPMIYSKKSILNDYQNLLVEMPAAMKAVLIDKEPMPATLPIDVDVYVKFGKRAERLYDLSARWKLLTPYLSYLEKNRENDIRGYYFLSQVSGLENELANWKDLGLDKKNQYREWLAQMCRNEKGTHADCEGEVRLAESQNELFMAYNTWLPFAKAKWNLFFDIQLRRSDVDWSPRREDIATIPFQDPNDERILQFLKTNIEDEFRTASWNLKLQFTASNEDIPRVEFQPGVTPHVNKMAGNIIIMDKNSSLEEWDTQWTIRHEFGHVLGLPDCYLEFYNPSEEEIIAYQLDTANFMCSRAGTFQSLHFDELKKNYFK